MTLMKVDYFACKVMEHFFHGDGSMSEMQGEMGHQFSKKLNFE